jgi:hypothetical protein
MESNKQASSHMHRCHQLFIAYDAHLLVLQASWLGGPWPQPLKVRMQQPVARQLMATLPSAATLRQQPLQGSRDNTGGSTKDDTGAAAAAMMVVAVQAPGILAGSGRLYNV